MSDDVEQMTPRLSWVAALFGLLVGLTMLYVPYEFGAAVFRPIYEDIRPMGAVLFVSGVLLWASILYPGGPGIIRWSGRILLLLGIARYWHFVSLRSGNVTGLLIYPLLITLLMMEQSRPFRLRETLTAFCVSVGIAFGVILIFAPASFMPASFQNHQAHFPLFGAYLFISAAVLAVGAWLRRPVVKKVGFLLFAGGFATVSWPLVGQRSWIALELYGSAAVVSLIAGSPWLPSLAGIRWRLLRGLTLASVFPILALGALTSKVAQDAIRAELWTEVRQLTSAEVSNLEELSRQARHQLSVEAAEPEVGEWLERGDLEPLRQWLVKTDRRSLAFDHMRVVNVEGQTIAASPSQTEGLGFDDRDQEYFLSVVNRRQPFLSRPLQNQRGEPIVLLAQPILRQQRLVGILVGDFLLDHLSEERGSPHAQGYNIQIFDRRDGQLLRDSSGGASLRPVRLTSDARVDVGRSPSGIHEHFDDRGVLNLVAHQEVQSSPWVVTVTVRASEAYAPLNRLSAWVVAIAFATAGLAVLLSHLVSLEITTRLGALRLSFARWTGLSRTREALPQTSDELADLETALRDMAIEIEHAQTELRSAVAVRDDFLSVASHELRTPLTPLKATLDLIVRQAESGETFQSAKQKNAIERMRRQVDRLGRLVNALLDVSRIRAGRFMLELAEMNLTAVLAEIAERMSHDQPQRANQLRVELPEGPVAGQWDADRLDQVVTNLLENAFRYSPGGTPVTLALTSTDDSAEIVIRDEGMGIPKDSLPKVFAPFFRAQNAAASHSGGLGLGLSICREIVERHGGRIWADSEGPGLGSRFHVVLPRHPR